MIDKIFLAKSDMVREGESPLFLLINPALVPEIMIEATFLRNFNGGRHVLGKLFGLTIVSTPYINKWKVSEEGIYYEFPKKEEKIMKKIIICPACKGAGTVKIEKRKLANFFSILQKERIEVCKRCNGRGEIEVQ